MESTDSEIKKILKDAIPGDADLRESIATKFAALGLDEKAKSDAENTITLYSLEYEKAAERYQGIYTSIWTNFSYMSVVAGGILTFGGNLYPNTSLITFLASLPLIFWYIATFVPLNRYGNDAIKRLKEIEAILNQRFGVNLDHFASYEGRKFPRVRPVMFIFALTLLGFSIYFGYQYFFNHSSRIEPSDLTGIKEIALRLMPEQQKQPSPPAPKSSPTAQNAENEQSGEQIKLSPAEKPIDRKIQENLSEKTKKLLLEFKESAFTMASKELQTNLVYDFNKVIEGKPVCNDTMQDNPEACQDAEVKSLYSKVNTTEDLMLANRRVLEKSYSDTVISPTKFPWAIFIFLPLFFIFCLTIVYEIRPFWENLKTAGDDFRVWLKIELGFWKEKESRLKLISLNGEGASIEVPVSPDVVKAFSKLLWSNNKTNLLLRVWKLPDNSVKWTTENKEDVAVTAFVEEGGKLKLIELNKTRMERLPQNQPNKN